MAWPITTVKLQFEDDLAGARQRAREVARALTFDLHDETRIATAVSEMARRLIRTTQSGEVEFLVEGDLAPQVLIVRIAETSSGKRRAKASSPPVISSEAVVSDEEKEGWLAAQRLMDQCEARTGPDGLKAVWLKKVFAKRAPCFTPKQLKRLEEQFGTQPPGNPLEEVRQQNSELVRTLQELHDRQQELERLNRELEDTNRGVVALYAELDEKAGHLRRADEMKSSFLSDMSHEFRTPLNAILSLSRLLLERTDGPLTSEQERQVRYIRQSGDDLLETVNDLLDLAKIEAGKVEVKPSEFEVGTLFSALRGMLRPLLSGESVELIFEQPQNLQLLWTDERKVSQILRNFISNALKFTERGQVRVSALAVEDGQSIAFVVADTGIGIASEDLGKIFEEFTQIDSAMQSRVKGTGLGLPLCRKLAGLLGGRVEVHSTPGVGSTFTVVIPVRYAAPQGIEPIEAEPDTQPVADKITVLVVEDDPQTRLLYDKYFQDSQFQPIKAGSIRQARELLRRRPVGAIVLDIKLPGDAWGWLAELKAEEATRHIPVLVASSVDDPRKGLALGADRYAIKPIYRHWLLEQLTVLTGGDAKPSRAIPLILVIDDQETDRYLVRRLAGGAGCSIVEATDGMEGVALARELKPNVILVDLSMPGMSGEDVVQALRADSQTSHIPVVIITAHTPGADRLVSNGWVAAVMDKHCLSAAALDQLLLDLGLKKTVELVGGESNA